jgi:hypothetical protein
VRRDARKRYLLLLKSHCRTVHERVCVNTTKERNLKSISIIKISSSLLLYCSTRHYATLLRSLYIYFYSSLDSLCANKLPLEKFLTKALAFPPATKLSRLASLLTSSSFRFNVAGMPPLGFLNELPPLRDPSNEPGGCCAGFVPSRERRSGLIFFFASL